MTNELWTHPVDSWLTAQRAVGRTAGTLKTRAEHLRWLTTWAGDRSPWSLTTGDLLAFMGSKKWARETRRGVRSSLRTFYAWAHGSGLTATNPAAGIPSVKPTPPAPRPIPEQQLREALMAAPPRERLMLELAAMVGLRRAEVAQVHTRDLIQDLAGWSLVVHGKGGKDRTIPLPGRIARELRDMPPGWVFPGDDAGHLSPRWVGTLISRLLPTGFTMHAARHRFATTTYHVDNDLFAVQDLLGHASPATTRAYVLMDQANARRLVDAVSDPFASTPRARALRRSA